MKESVLRKQVLQTRHLPPLSVTANQLLKTVANSEVEIDNLSDIISRDPGLSARILGLANAAYFGQIRAVTTIREAIIRVLGLNMVKSLALSIAMSGSFDTKRCPGFDLEGYWTKAIGCAELGRMIAMRLPAEIRPDPSAIYLCGLLHNLGALVIACVFPSECSKAHRAHRQDPARDLAALEREYVGITGQQAMQWLGIRWHLPGFVVRAVSYYRDMTYSGPGDTMILVMGAAARWVRTESPAAGRLAEEHVLRDRLHMTPQVLSDIEERFRSQLDELRALARTLS